MNEFRFEDTAEKLSIHFENYTLRKMDLLPKYILFCHLGIQDHICLNLKYMIPSHNPLQVKVAYTFKIYSQETFSIT